MIVESFQIEHVRQMRVRSEQRFAMKFCSDEYLERLKAAGAAVTVRTDEQEIVGCAGVANTPDASYLWCFMGQCAQRHKITVYRTARRLVKMARRPLLATTPEWFTDGRRLLERLGLHEVGPCGQEVAALDGQLLYRLDE